MKTKKLSIALVGCGRISLKHLEAILYNSDDYQLAAVFDTDFTRAKQVGDQYGAPYFDSYKTMLKDVIDIDLVSICTPSGLHPEHCIIALEQGKHVVTEKPMACIVEDARLMLKAAKDANKKLFVVKQNRLNPTVLALKKAITEGYFGKIYLVQTNVFWSRPQENYDEAKWRGTRAFDGGALMNQASHYVDLLEYFLERVDSVQAMTKTLGRNIETEDTAIVNLAWKCGALGSMSVTMLTYPKNLEGSITILGEKGSIQLDGAGLNEIKYLYFKDSLALDIFQTTSDTKNSYSTTGHGLYYKNVADTLLRDGKAISDGESGIKSVELLCAIYESAKTGNIVSVRDYVDSLEPISI